MTNWRDWFQESATQHGDSLAASHYDSARSFYVRQRAVLNRLGNIRGQVILDVGPGSGHFSAQLAYRNTVIGLDFAPTMLTFARKKGLVPVQGDAVALPLPDQSVDVVICIGVMQHIIQPEAFLNELMRVRKPNGHLFLGTLNRESLARWLYYRVTREQEIMHTYRMGDVLAEIGSRAVGVDIDASALYYPLPGFRWVGESPLLSRFLASAFIIHAR